MPSAETRESRGGGIPKGRVESRVRHIEFGGQQDTHWWTNPAGVGKVDLESREKHPATGVRVTHRQMRGEKIGLGGCSSILVFSFLLKIGFFFVPMFLVVCRSD